MSPDEINEELVDVPKCPRAEHGRQVWTTSGAGQYETNTLSSCSIYSTLSARTTGAA